jgi:hypothetical protein
VIADATPSGPPHAAEIHLERELDGSCWIAARAHEEIGPYRARGLDFSTVHIAEGTLLGNYYGTRRPETAFAHTSPAYVLVDGKPIRSWQDADYYVRYMNSSIEWLKTEAKFARPSDRQASIEAFERGRAIYQERARRPRA